VVKWRVVFTTQALWDARKIRAAGLRSRAEKRLEVLQKNPFHNPPRFERLVGDLKGAYSRRITVQQRLVYQVLEADRVVKVMRMWTYYE
jgi:Txe/YoeB family toxin of toxin-antitoxin system